MANKEDKIQDQTTEEQVNTVDETEETTSTEEIKEEIEEKVEPTAEEKLAELNDKYLRLYSDFDNYRKRTMKEKADLISNAGAGVVKDLLSVMDDFERATKNNETSEDINGIKEGFTLIANKMNNVLIAKGVKKMEAQNQPFNSDLHEAITNIPAPTDDLKGKVVDVIEQGYYLNDKVIRYAKVVVGQ